VPWGVQTEMETTDIIRGYHLMVVYLVGFLTGRGNRRGRERGGGKLKCALTRDS